MAADPRAALDSLGLPTVPGAVPVPYSRGHEARARALQVQLMRAADYFAERLQVRPTLVLAVLARDDWQALTTGVVYGMPWSDVGRWSSVVVLPATHAMFDEFGAAIKQQSAASAAVGQAERSTRLSLEDGVRLAADATMYDELGHVFSRAYGIGHQNLWFGEFVANCFAEAYQAEVVPDTRVPWFDRLLHDWADGASQPKYTALEDLERLYLSIGPANYAWYQTQFGDRAKAVYKTEGFGFIPRLKTVLPSTEEGHALPVPEVLARLERISPGFVAWGEALAARSR